MSYVLHLKDYNAITLVMQDCTKKKIQTCKFFVRYATRKNIRNNIIYYMNKTSNTFNVGTLNLARLAGRLVAGLGFIWLWVITSYPPRTSLPMHRFAIVATGEATKAKSTVIVVNIRQLSNN